MSDTISPTWSSGDSHPSTGWIGKPLRRREDPKFLRGQATYVDDLVLPGMVHLVVVRSPHAHARIRGIAEDAARRHSGVLAVLTAADLAGRVRPVPPAALEGARVAPIGHPILAQDKVRYVGEPVAAVVADSVIGAMDAAELVEVDYEPLPAVVDPRQALAGVVLLHETLGENVVLRWDRASGDVDGAFRAAAHVVRQQFRIPRLAAAPIEPRGAVASYDPGADLLTVWGSNQDPHRPLAELSRILGRPEDRIRMIIPDVGGAFGSKGHAAMETAVAAVAAMMLHRPVKWVEGRRENFLGAHQGRGIEAEMEMALASDGRITAVRARLLADLGAYLFLPTANVPVTTAMLLTGAYQIPAAEVELTGVTTNKVPTAPYRGAGRPEAAYLVERMVDLAAREVELDPVEMRRRNLIPPDRFPYRTPLGFVYDSGTYERAMNRACQVLEYDRWRATQRTSRPTGRLIGVGVATYVERAGARLWESAAASVGPDGRITVRMGSTPTGQGHETTFAQIAAEVLQVDPDTIIIRQGDSAVVPRGVGTFGSRSTTIGGSALWQTMEKIKAKLGSIAAHLLEVSAQDLEWSDGRIRVRGTPDRALTLAQVAAAAYRPGRLPEGMELGLEAATVFALSGPVFPFGTYAAVVEIDPETGTVTILRLVAADDAGRIVNPLLAEGQVIGASIQGLGQALSEEMVYDQDGQPLTAAFTDYALLRAAQAPAITSELLETPSPLNPLGAKGIGEAGSIAMPAAVANAVCDALAARGIRHLDLPLQPPKIWSAIRQHSRV